MKGFNAANLLLGILFVSGCVTEATVELTKAPFDATTALSDGTSKAVGEILEPTRKFLSSTTPGAAAIDHFTRAREKTELFVGFSYEHLRTDIARGSGEHVASLAVLAGIPAEQRVQFQENMQNRYTLLFNESLSPRETRLRLVETAWAEGFGRLESDTIKHQETGISDMDLQVGTSRKSNVLISRQ
jgi:hypothetical protein